MTLLVEVCAGSAALTRHLLGLGKVVGYMGGKDGYAAAIAEAWGCPAPSAVWLNDPGYWGAIWPGLVTAPAQVAKHIETWLEEDARELWNRLRSTTAVGPELAAARLCQLAGTHGGGEIGGFKGKHIRRPSVDGFIPNRASLAERASALNVTVPAVVTALDAAQIVVRGAWCYIDPPYAGVTGYTHDLPRARVIEIARRLATAGNRVAVSEREAIPELVADGWTAHELTGQRTGQNRRNSRSSAEWLTVYSESSKLK